MGEAKRREAMTALLEAGKEAEPQLTSAVVTSTLPSLETACNVIMNHLPDHQRNLILDLCADTGRPVSDYLLSYIRLADERGETATVMTEATETVGVSATVGFGSFKCDYCGKQQPASRRGQKFCPPPEDGSESCGRKKGLEDLHRRRPQAMSAQHLLAQKNGLG